MHRSLTVEGRTLMSVVEAGPVYERCPPADRPPHAVCQLTDSSSVDRLGLWAEPATSFNARALARCVLPYGFHGICLIASLCPPSTASLDEGGRDDAGIEVDKKEQQGYR